MVVVLLVLFAAALVAAACSSRVRSVLIGLGVAGVTDAQGRMAPVAGDARLRFALLDGP